MALPFKPETLTAAKQRIPAALSLVWDAAKVSQQLRDHGRFDAESPLNRREHVFDFADGLRLVVNREKVKRRLRDQRSPVVVHVSASVRVEKALPFDLHAADGQKQLWILMAERIAQLLSTAEVPCEVPEEPDRWDRGVGHWVLEDFFERNPMNLREVYEQETGESPFVPGRGEFHPGYVRWLEEKVTLLTEQRDAVRVTRSTSPPFSFVDD